MQSKMENSLTTKQYDQVESQLVKIKLDKYNASNLILGLPVKAEDDKEYNIPYEDSLFLCCKNKTWFAASISTTSSFRGSPNCASGWMYVDCERHKICYGVNELDSIYWIKK
jgi:hypothetical protein